MPLTDEKSIFEKVDRFSNAIKDSFLRHDWPPKSFRSRSQTIFSNFFLHIHSTKIHPYSLKPSFTMGFGLVSFFLFILLAITGILLMIYYNPSTLLAYDSVKDISVTVVTGKYLRNIHRWAAHGMVLMVLLHMVRVFYTGAYKGPRKFNWVIGMILFIITIGLSYTGYLLPWDQLAYWAVTIGANIAASPRELTDALGITQYFDIGGILKSILLGGSTVNQEALTRFYLLHVIFLPLICAVLIGVHFWRIRKDGGLSRPNPLPEKFAHRNQKNILQSTTPGLNPNKTYGLMLLTKNNSPLVNRNEPDDTIFSWPTAIWAEISVFMATFAIMTMLAYFFDAPLKEIANPLIPENPAKAPWYFLGLQELVSYSAFLGGIGIPTIVILGLIVIPYIDLDSSQVGIWFSGKEGRKITFLSSIFATIFTLGLLTITVKYGWLRNWFPTVPQLVIVFVNPGSILVLAFSLWSIQTYRWTLSSRMAAIALFTCFIIGFILLTIMGLHFRGPNWDFYWSPSQWPVH